ncbi:MAG: hypothetical protein ACREJ3_10325 [Polyangiaceae bacterium]
MSRPRKGCVEPRRRANGALYFLARARNIWSVLTSFDEGGLHLEAR